MATNASKYIPSNEHSANMFETCNTQSFSQWPYTKQITDKNAPSAEDCLTIENTYSDDNNNTSEIGGEMLDGNDDGRRGNNS